MEAALDSVGLASSASRRFGTYSTGMKQRLGVAAALLKEPELLILDEPSNGLDPQGMAEMRRFVRSLAEGGRTVLLSSHLLSEVQQVCDRVGVISGGRLIAEESVAALTGEPRLLLRAEPMEVAHDLLAREFGPEAVRRRDGLLQLAVPPGQSWDVNRRLTAAGIAVSELRAQEASLEEVFFQLTEKEASS